MPLLYYLLAFISGEIASHFFKLKSSYWVYFELFILTVIVIQLLQKKNRKFSITLIGLSFCTGGFLIAAQTNQTQTISYQKGQISFSLIEKTNKPNVFVAKINTSYFEKPFCILADLTSDSIHQFHIGDDITGQGTILPLYTRKDNLLYSNKFVMTNLTVQKQVDFQFTTIPNHVQGFLTDHLVTLVPDSNSRSMIQAMVWGDTSALSQSLKSEFKASGTYHLLAVSGMQISLIVTFLTWFHNKIGQKYKRLKWASMTFILTTIIFFALVAGGSASVWRATIMGAISLIGLRMSIQSSKFQSLTATVFISLLVFPEFLFNLGFILSITAIFGIYFIHPILRKRIKSKRRPLDRLFELMSITLSTQIALFPILWYTFGTFPTYFLFSNLILVPLCTVLIFAVILGMFTIHIPFIHEVIQCIVRLAGNWTIEINHYIASLPNSSFFLPEIKFSQAFILGIAIYLFFFSINKKAALCMQVSLCVVFVFEILRGKNVANDSQIRFHSQYESDAFFFQNNKSKIFSGDSLPTEIEFNSKRIQIIQESNEILPNFDCYIFSNRSATRFLDENELAVIRNSEILFSKKISKKKKKWMKSKLDSSNCENFLNYSSNAYL
ncbi:MAG: ComEC/Rec2 family competence protein [Bacteroidota bacterium]|jgi:ComEC/Rec2-related protein